MEKTTKRNPLLISEKAANANERLLSEKQKKPNY